MVLATRLPLWRIDIWAPQYPEGLSMEIGLDKIEGNIDQINILNHYIGMKKIEPQGIPEFKVIPKVFLFLNAVGVLAIVVNTTIVYAGWLGITVISGVVGMFDFYKWGYDYGHNLNPHAPIQVSGMSYQPPLIGHKTLLNIEAYSLPSWGTYLLLLSLAIIFTLLTWDKMSKLLRPYGKVSPKILLVLCSLFSVHFFGCTSKPEPIDLKRDECAHCRMRITDDHFGAEIITKKGKILKFDSVSCLLEHLKKDTDSEAKVYVEDYFKPGSLIPVSEAQFLESEELHAPMGVGLAASVDVNSLAQMKKKLNGETFDWNSLKSKK
jgi:copper chaperone NosL